MCDTLLTYFSLVFFCNFDVVFMKHDIKALNPASWKYKSSTYLGTSSLRGSFPLPYFFYHFTQTDIFLDEAK